MKKYKIVITTALLILLVVFVVLYKNWQRQAYKEVVHADATTIIKVDVNELMKTLAWDFVGNMEYYSSKEEDSISGEKSDGKGINIPASVFLYTVPKASNTIFCTLKISDSTQAISYLSKTLGASHEVKREGFYQKTNKKKTISIAQLDKTVVIALSYKKEDVSKVFEEILIHKKYMVPTHHLLQQLINEEHHISIAGRKEMMLHLDGKDGVIELTGSFNNSSEIIFNKSSKVPSFSNNKCIQMYMSGKPKNKLSLSKIFGKEINWGTTTLATDSITQHFNDLITFQLGGTTFQKDSIITYEYNDDFEKVPVVSLKEKTVPNMSLSITADSTNTIERYLKNSRVIDKNQFVKEIPFYQFYAAQKENKFIVSTSKEFSLPFQKTEMSTDFFRIQVHIDQLIKENHFPIINSYISSMNSIDIKAKNNDTKTIHLEGIITFKERTINAFTQIFK
ncbi:hypothetical protein [Aquimarina sediminis]|uniref:hypothetical protein n=1 Tax=Aquimarina sediminis TaxID=2070536 RepID=UPI000CA06812|nr:hypothetical protein [Aquimarina sediminis]